jgi:pyruvate/2-oxoglutarate dehydrogenase complex dihydrolipoamide dehydrogenase (E3) component
MAAERSYDAVVIGAGQGGTPLSMVLAKAGLETAVVEERYVGGSCVNYGCTPTKTMAASARVAYLARRASDYGVQTGPVTVNLAQVRERKQKVVERFRNGAEQVLEATGNLDVIRGEASFIDARTLKVERAGSEALRLSAEKIFLNTGAKPVIPPIDGLNRVPSLDSTSIMELDSVPKHLLIVGGGYIAIEFGQMFRRYGSQVTIIELGEQLLAREDSDVAEEVYKILREDGIDVRLKTRASRVETNEQGQIQLTVSGDSSETAVEGSHLLIAAGRRPNVDHLNLRAAGVEMDEKGYVKVNDRLETSVSGIYAIGDIKPGPAFTHISYDDFRIIQANLLQNGDARIEGRPVPYTIFMDPQLGRVGLTEKEARAQGRSIRIAKLAMANVARGIEFGETRGLMKAVVDAETNQILGCAILGMEGGEVMAVLQVAMMGKLPYTVIRDGIFAHPTLAESLNNLFMAMDGRGLHEEK